MSSPFSFPASLRTLAVLGLALALGACSRSLQPTEPVSSSVRAGAPAAALVACPALVANTPATALDYVVSSGMVASFTTRRIRFEMFGDIPSPRVKDMGSCAASETPTIRFTGGHANVFVHGTTQSITFTGGPLTFGPLLFPGSLIEPGVVVTNDAEGNVLEIIWPELAGTGIGDPIVRVQLARWNLNLVSTANTYDVVWDMSVEEDGVTMYFKGRADRLNLSGSAVPQGGGGSITPCPTTLAGTSGPVVNQLAGIVQFRSKRLRIEVNGDVSTATIEATGACAAADPATISFTGGSANAFQAGTTTSVTSTGRALTFGPLLFPGLTLEAGVVVAQDADKNVLEIIWPGLAGLPPGPPILRLQLAKWNNWVRTGRSIDVTMRFNARGPDGSTASYDVRANGLVVPSQR